jgi:hypothetical protein
VQMLKKSALHPSCPQRAETRRLPAFVPAYLDPATYLIQYISALRIAAASLGKGCVLAPLGWAGEIETFEQCKVSSSTPDQAPTSSSFNLSALIRSRNCAAFSNSSSFAAAFMSSSNFRMVTSSS